MLDGHHKKTTTVKQVDKTKKKKGYNCINNFYEGKILDRKLTCKSQKTFVATYRLD